MSKSPTILFAGGGTGGHIFPNLAILERLREQVGDVSPRFLLSNRALDAQILTKAAIPFTSLPVRSLTMRPWRWPAFYAAWRQSVAAVCRVIDETSARAVVATGGFVSGPAIVAARKRAIPAALVNLDAVPGKANRAMAGKAAAVFSAYATEQLPNAQIIGMPLRRCVVGSDDKASARQELGLDPQRETLFITGASQGAQSVNRLMIALAGRPEFAAAMTTGRWQILHLSGDKDADALRTAYRDANIPSTVMSFCDQMGLAWSAASLALSRAGAGSVAEAWANAVPTVFLPYPFHRDQHQRLNAQPLVDVGAAVLMTDLIDPAANVSQLGPTLNSLLADAARRQRMAQKLRDTRPADGAATVAGWLATIIG